jgi:hypothetical protein
MEYTVCSLVFLIKDELSSEQVVATVTSRQHGKNAATTLIAASLNHAALRCPGGVEELLAIPAPQCRRYRDDMTVQVMFFNGEVGNDVPMVELGLPKRVDRVGPLLAGRAKL